MKNNCKIETLEQVANMSRDLIESHPLTNSNYYIKEYIMGYIPFDGDAKTDDYFTLFLALMSLQVYYSEKDGDDITHLLDFMKERLDDLLKYVEVEQSTLSSIGEIVGNTMLKFVIEYFFNTEYRDIIIDGLMNLDDDYNEEREVLEGILRDHYDDIDLIVFIATHENWRSMRSTIEMAIEENEILKIVFKLENIQHIVDEFEI